MKKSNASEIQYSISPEGDKFPIPAKQDYKHEYERLQKLVTGEKKNGKQIVVVLGVGFVGAVMAGIIADAKDQDGKPLYYVIGCQRPSVRSYWKIPLLNQGQSPVKADDPEVDVIINRCVNEQHNLVATYNNDCLKLADIVVVDIQCDYTKHDLGMMKTGEAEMTAFEQSMKIIGENFPKSS